MDKWLIAEEGNTKEVTSNSQSERLMNFLSKNWLF